MTQSNVAGGTVPPGPLPPGGFPPATLIRLYRFLKSKQPISIELLEQRFWILLDPRALARAVNWPVCAGLVEDDGIEPTTPCLQSRCSPS